MARRPRRNHSPAFKAKAAVSAIKGEKTLIELAQEMSVSKRSGTHPQSELGVLYILALLQVKKLEAYMKIRVIVVGRTIKTYVRSNLGIIPM